MGTLVNGALYWPVSNFYNFPDIKYRILGFQLADEKHSWVQASKAMDKYCRLRLMIFEGKLCVKNLEILGIEGWFNQQLHMKKAFESLAPYEGNKNGIKRGN